MSKFERMGESTDLERSVPEEDFVKLPCVVPKEKAIEMAEKEKTNLFGRIYTPDPSEVELKETGVVEKPVWVLSGSYTCKWLNVTDYHLPVPDDVEEIKIGGNEHSVRSEAMTLRDFFEEMGLSLNPVGTQPEGIGNVLNRLGVGGSKSFGVNRKVVLSGVKEFRKEEREEEICLDIESGKVKEEFLELMKKVNEQKAESKTSRGSEKWAVDKFFEEKFEESDKFIEEECKEIYSRSLKVDSIKHVLIPFYRIIFEKEGERKGYLINAVDESMNKVE